MTRNEQGDADGLLLKDGTMVRFPAARDDDPTRTISPDDRVTIEGWTHLGESEIHAATIRKEPSGRPIVVDRPPPEISGLDRHVRGQGREKTEGGRPAPRRETAAGPRSGRGPEGPRPPRREPGSGYSLEQATSDRAQLHTIAFDGLAFLTGDIAADTFLPPGKVSDYFGFQYLRDIDAAGGGHNTSFLTRIAYDVLTILSDSQKAQLASLAEHQEANIRRFAELRFPLIVAFRRNLAGDIPTGSRGLDRQAVVRYSAQLYELDGLLAFERARVMGSILRGLDPAQRAAMYYSAALRGPSRKHDPNPRRFLERRPWGNISEKSRQTLARRLMVATPLSTWLCGSCGVVLKACAVVLGPASAILQRGLKLIHEYETGSTRLYDLARDPGERHDLAQEMAVEARELNRLLRDALVRVGAQFPSRNPDYDPTRVPATKQHRRQRRGGQDRAAGARRGGRGRRGDGDDRP